MQLSEKAAYIKGLIDGLELDPTDKQTKIFKLIAELLSEMADEIKELEQCYDDVCDQVDGISEDLSGVEDLLSYEDYGDDLEYSDSDDEELSYEVTCPNCGNVNYVSEDALNDGVMRCQECNEILEFDFNEDELDESEEEE